MTRFDAECFREYAFPDQFVARLIELLRDEGYEVGYGDPDQDRTDYDDEIPEEIFGHAVEVAKAELERRQTKLIQ